MFKFRTKRGWAKIVCELSYARWLIDTGRVSMGIYTCPGNRIYL